MTIDIGHWQINVCPMCRKQTARSGCAGTPSEPHEMVKAEVVDVVRASTTEGAVEDLHVAVELLHQAAAVTDDPQAKRVWAESAREITRKWGQ